MPQEVYVRESDCGYTLLVVRKGLHYSRALKEESSPGDMLGKRFKGSNVDKVQHLQSQI